MAAEAPKVYLLPWIESQVSVKLHEPLEHIKVPESMLRSSLWTAISTNHLLNLSRDEELSMEGDLQDGKCVA